MPELPEHPRIAPTNAGDAVQTNAGVAVDPMRPTPNPFALTDLDLTVSEP